MAHWSEDAVFYHIYPLGYCAAPERNDFVSPPVGRLDLITDRLDTILALGVTALYIGPLFESSTHGYDTVDYDLVDRRLGDEADLVRLVGEAHRRGIRVIIDAVFNHIGREHPWFRSLREQGRASPHASAFEGLRFDAISPFGDPFSYEGWKGHYDLVKLNLGDEATANGLIETALSWIERFDIDGLRLDAADCIDLGFQSRLAAACKERRPDFWLLGEIVHGDYRRWAASGLLDSVTNYECWKGLWSSLNDANYYEIAYALTRQFGPDGIYRGLPLYAFADNHDVDRVASLLEEPAHLYPLYCLLFTMPGVPSIYYGSELGATGRKTRGSDAALRAPMAELEARAPEPDLAPAIAKLAALRRCLPALRYGGYRELRVAHRQLAFERSLPDGSATVIVALNSAKVGASVEVRIEAEGAVFVDALNDASRYRVERGRCRIDIPSTWARVLVPA